MVTTICFLARPSFDKFSIAILKNLREKYDLNIEGCFITSDLKETNFIKNNIENVCIFEVSDFIEKNWCKFTEEKLQEYEYKYDCAPIWKYIYTDRFLREREYDYVVKITVGLFMFFEHVYETTNAKVYYSETIATLQCYIAYIVGKKFGVKYIAQMCARGNLDSSYHYFIKDEFQHNINFDENYRETTYSCDELAIAEKYLNDFEKDDSPPPAMQLVKTEPHFKIGYLFKPIKRLIKRFDKYLSNPYSYMYYKSYKHYTDELQFYYNYKVSKKFYRNADFSKKYVYFPLHYQPEASTCVCAQKYENQLFFIDSWAKSLPADTVLYVKEHYALLGHRDPQFYTELKKYPNVVLINPWVSTRKLIENSQAVTTLTGTAGLEAILLGKPVFLGGSTVFDNAPGIIKINDIYLNYIDYINKWRKPHRRELLQYICACFRSYHKGNAYAQNYYHLINDNIDDLCNSLYKQLIVNNCNSSTEGAE